MDLVEVAYRLEGTDQEWLERWHEQAVDAPSSVDALRWRARVVSPGMPVARLRD
jgi:hypothetical protein